MRLQSLFSGNSNPDASYAGQDSSGLITVKVDGKGQVIDVQIASAWRNTIGTHGLGPAVLEAVSDGTNQVAAAWGTSFVERQEQNVDEPAPPPEPPEGQPTNDSLKLPGNQQARNALQEVLTLIEGVEDALDDFEQSTNQQTNQHVVGHGPENGAKVTITGANQVVDVEVTRNLAGRAPEGRLSRELLGAFKTAYERTASLNGNASHADGPLDKIRTLSSDPAKLLAHLGFTDEGTAK